MHAAKLPACVAFLPEINPTPGSHEVPELQILDFLCKKMNSRARRAYRFPRSNSNNSEQAAVLDCPERTLRLAIRLSRNPLPAEARHHSYSMSLEESL